VGGFEGKEPRPQELFIQKFFRKFDDGGTAMRAGEGAGPIVFEIYNYMQILSLRP
jgi:hypothetical protein